MIARFSYCALAALAVGITQPAYAADDEAAADSSRPEILVTGARQASNAGTKTDTPLSETPQSITVITDDTFLSQGAISISDTVRYVAGVQANPYGADSRIDDALIRGISPLQFRDGMRDIFSFYATIRADPYNFSSVEVLRGPASVLFGAGSIGGIINTVSKVPEFDTKGEASLVYGSFDRMEALADVNTTLGDNIAGRIVARVRDADTQVKYVPDDRVMMAPSLRWQPSPATDITLIGLYQEDDGGSTAQFLPLEGTLQPNPNGPLPHNLFIGKPGWDRYEGRLLQGTGMISHEFNESLRLNLKARYIDSNLDYFTHYPDSYTDRTDTDGDGEVDSPYIGPEQRIIGNFASGSIARMEIFSTDNNVQFNFNTGDAFQHLLLAGVDYSWNRVRKTGGMGYEFIDIYDIDYSALSNYGGGLPTAADPNFMAESASYEDTSQKQLGFYLQDQIRIIDRISVVLGVRRDNLETKNTLGVVVKDKATTFRAGIIGEVVEGVSPFFSYTESFDPISGTTGDGTAFKPKRGRQFEGGIKYHPDDATMVTATGFHIREYNRPISDDTTDDPFDQRQAGSLTSKGFEFEAIRILPGNYEIIANYSYVWIQEEGTDQQLSDVAKHSASIWGTKTFKMNEDTGLRLGAGVRYISDRHSGPITTPEYTLVDALAEIKHGPWLFAINANNLLGKQYFANCLSRGDCFNGADRSVFGTVSYRF
jgi:iron complex outermembrane recepter protein